MCFEVKKRIPVFHLVYVARFHCVDFVVGSKEINILKNKNLKYHLRSFSDIPVDIIVTPCIELHIVSINCSVFYERFIYEVVFIKHIKF